MTDTMTTPAPSETTLTADERIVELEARLDWLEGLLGASMGFMAALLNDQPAPSDEGAQDG